MSDQGERSVRWTEMSDDVPDGGQEPGAAEAATPRMTFPEAKVPEVRLPAPEGRTDFSGEEPHDVWGKVEAPGPQPGAEPEPEAAAGPASAPEAQPAESDPLAGAAEEPRVPENDDIKVAPVPEVGADTDPYATPAVPPAAEAEQPDPGTAAPEADPYAAASALEADPYAATPGADPYAPAASGADPYASGADPYASGAPGAAPAASGAEPYGPGASDPYAPSADPYAPGATGDDDLAVAGSPPVQRETELPPRSNVPGAQAWEGSLFDGSGGSESDPDGKYAPVEQIGPATPPKPGKPSSGNWRMPEWMEDEESADAKLGGRTSDDLGDSGKKAASSRRAERDRDRGRDHDRGHDRDPFDGGGSRSRLVLFGGVGLLVIAIIAAGGVYFMKNGDDSAPAASEGKQNRPVAPDAPPQPEEPKVQLPPVKPFKPFAGKPGKMLGRVTDAHSGLAYPRFAGPWQVPSKKNKLGIAGWSGQQILVTEKHGARLWYGQALTGTLIPTLQSAYKGPESLKTVTALAASGLEANYYGFPHHKAPYSFSELNVDGHKGWLIVSYLTYKRPGVKATGEVVGTAVIDTGRKTPAVAFVSVPNTHRKMWPDVTQFFQQLKVAG
ncbi:hypothetical protein J4573_14575 [Actinomadura barringtoniae]|uniref:Uncharacterized protein n=1 Tax=Actinomadura barringtoniae TaxID=1427535 RepID=A0A939T6J1_9ACTN|nr:hypothetical protein [Actinomadura barringtoniae]MBO2448327.1 hypothetical protein [Actinomadura barringtoniae]